MPAAPRPVVYATRNQGKLAEARAILRGVFAPVLSLEDVPGAPDVEESEPTFAGNALLKARAAAAAAGGAAAIGDDSGLCVDALGGAPGVRSARFAADAGAGRGDAANNALLLARLAGVESAQRGARFVCVLAYVEPGAGPGVAAREELVEGVCPGMIAAVPSGDGGFGYDPLFFLPELGVTMAELLAEEKNLVSHRARAFAALLAVLRAPAS